MREDADKTAEVDDPLGTVITKEFAKELVDTCIERGILVDFLKSKSLDELVELLKAQTEQEIIQRFLSGERFDEEDDDIQ